MDEGGALYDLERLSTVQPGGQIDWVTGQVGSGTGGGATRGPKDPEDTERSAKER